MGLSLRAGATALASVLAFAGVANSQGFYFSSNEGECDPKYNFQYLGCAATTSQPFAYSPTSWDYQGDNSKSVIFFDKGDFVNQTITPYFCAQTCRHHGFKYSALWDKGCNCANSLDHTTPGGTTVTLSTTIDANSDTKCINGQDGQPYGNCGGDLRESCGSNQGARIFVDPSFPDERDLGTPAQIAAIAQSYDLLGCFKTQNLPSSVDAVTKVQGISPSDCLNYCADLGSPLVSMTQTTTANSVNCLCGSDFGQGSQQVIVNDNSCSLSCADPTSTTPCTGQDCCGAGNGPFPIYANPKLMGCYIPVIPGVADPAADNPAPDGYDCFPTPQSILARDPSPVVSYVAKTMSASAVFKATAAPAANEYSVYGCYADTTPADLFNTPNAQTLTNVNVETCITACDNGGFAFAGVYGTTTGNNPGTTKCVCGSAGDLKTGVTPNNAMENCNQPCTGSAQENCGGNNGPLLYARAAIAADGPWHASWTVSYANTPTYSCKPTGSSAPGSSAPAPPVSSGPAASGAASSSAAESSPADGSSAAASSSPIISIPTTIPTDVPTSEPADSSSGAAGSSDAATTSGPIISIPTSISTDVSTTDQSGSPTEIGTVLPTTIISISQPESGSATPSDSSSVEPTSAPDATTGEPSEGPSSGPTDMSSEEPSGSATESPSAGPSDTVSPSGGVTSAPVSSSSGTVTMSSSASAVSNTVEPTVTLASTQIQPYGAIFDDSKVPPGTGIKANLVVYDSDGNPSTQEYVIMYVGCFEIAPGSSPFDGNKTDFVGKAQAGGSAGACSGFCAGVPMMLSADNSGDCFCGIDLAGSNVLTLAPNRDACNIPCEDDPSQTCGGGSKLQKRADSFLNIILAQPVDQAVLIPPPSSSSAVSSMPASSNAASSNASMMPTESSGLPIGSSDIPTGPSGLPTGPSGVPTGPSSMSVVPSGEPTGPSGVPTGPSGVPTDSSSMSAIPSGVPTGPSGIPTGPSGQPSSPSSASVGPNGTVPTGTGSAPSGSATSYPGIKTINSLVLLGVIPGDADQNQKRGVAALRRQATDGGFIGGAGPVNPASCDDATLFSLTNGELRSGGQPIATDPGVAYIPIHVNPTASISTTFSVVNGILHWYNTAFAGGEAGFCQVASGQVYATFAAPSTFPAGCAVVSIVVYESTQCQNGQIVPGGPTSVPGNGPGATATPLLPQERDIFPEGDAPDDELCVETTLSWVPGQPTFLPHGPNAEL